MDQPTSDMLAGVLRTTLNLVERSAEDPDSLTVREYRRAVLNLVRELEITDRAEDISQAHSELQLNLLE